MSSKRARVIALKSSDRPKDNFGLQPIGLSYAASPFVARCSVTALGRSRANRESKPAYLAKGKIRDYMRSSAG